MEVKAVLVGPRKIREDAGKIGIFSFLPRVVVPSVVPEQSIDLEEVCIIFIIIVWLSIVLVGLKISGFTSFLPKKSQDFFRHFCRYNLSISMSLRAGRVDRN